MSQQELHDLCFPLICRYPKSRLASGIGAIDIRSSLQQKLNYWQIPSTCSKEQGGSSISLLDIGISPAIKEKSYDR